MAEYSTLAAIDLGSNSFHCQIVRVVDDQIYPLDSLRDPVRLGGGLNDEKMLDAASQERALACLQRFGERLRGFDRHGVRAVGTNTLRVAKNAKMFLKLARAALGFPIEVIAGREEARLIYLGVQHSLPHSKERRLIVDIGGGSTEFIIGSGYKPQKLASLYMGCVSYSLQFFPDGRITKAAMKEAELAARNELQPLVAGFSRRQWQQAIGSSGTVRALAEILQGNGFTDGAVTLAGLDKLRSALVKAGSLDRIELEGLRPDRIPVLPGGLAILSAVLSELGIGEMTPATGAMREGLLYDLLGRVHRKDMRDVTVAQFMQRYHVDASQARRVGTLAQSLYKKLTVDATDADELDPTYIGWAAKLHEIGISVAYSGYHKHTAYIIGQATCRDSPGTNRTGVAPHAGAPALAQESGEPHRRRGRHALGARVAARRAVLSRTHGHPASRLPGQIPSRNLRLGLDSEWLARNPLTATALREEITEWGKIGFELKIPGWSSSKRARKPRSSPSRVI